MLVGADWCHACHDAKKTLPSKYPGVGLYFVDYDEGDDVDAKFSLNGFLPGIFRAHGSGRYEKLNS